MDTGEIWGLEEVMDLMVSGFRFSLLDLGLRVEGLTGFGFAIQSGGLGLAKGFVARLSGSRCPRSLIPD